MNNIVAESMVAPKNKADTFKTVFITSLFHREEHYNCCDDINGYKEHLKKHPDMVEIIGGYKQQVKPVFDLDDYDNLDINQFITDITPLFSGKKIVYAYREARDTPKGIKYSYRVYVIGIRITTQNLKSFIEQNEVFKKYLNTECLDTSIYDKSKTLYLPLTNKKKDGKVPPLIPVDCDVFDCCASYIEEDYEDWDALYFSNPNEVVKSEQVGNKLVKTLNSGATITEIIKDDNDNVEEDDEKLDVYDKLIRCIGHLSAKRSDAYATWINVCWAIINICTKSGMRQSKIEQLIHQFSKKSNNYIEKNVDDWIDKNFDKTREQSYGWKYLYDICIKEDDPAYYDGLTKSYFTMKTELEKTTCKILYPPAIVHIMSNGDFYFSKLSAFAESKGHEVCTVKEIDKKGKITYKEDKFIAHWFKDPKIRHYEKLDCDPTYTKTNIFNTWHGFEAEKLPPINDDAKINELCAPILHHIEEVITGKEHLGFFLSWLANIIQNPVKKSGVCILIRGEQGLGKNIILDFILYQLIGLRSASQNGSVETLFERFDNSTFNKVLGLVDEVNIKDLVGEKSKNAEKLKNLITSRTIKYEEKMIMKVDIPNMINLIFTSNNDNAVPIPFDDRRFTVFDCKNTYKGNKEYFDNLGKHLSNPEVARAFFEYLKKYDIRHITNFQLIRPITPYYNEMKRLNLPVIYRYLSFIVDNPPSDCYIIYLVKGKQFYDNFIWWLRDRNYQYSSNITCFGRDIKKITDRDRNIIDKERVSEGIQYRVNLQLLKTYLEENNLYDNNTF